MKTDVIVIGGGPAGLAAALSARENGAGVLILERDETLGGILNQCIHAGFGLHYFNEELTGPEYADRFVQQLNGTDIAVMTGTMALSIDESLTVRVICPGGYRELHAKAVVLAMGCRERTRGALGIPGDRPAGIFTAGAAQRYVNIEGYMVGSRVLVLGSGDIGLIMARRMTLEGAKVLGCVELMPYSGGLTRNIVQCLDDYDIPLYLSHTIVNIEGGKRARSATIAKVDEQRRPIGGTEFTVECDTILLSVGLIPENELSHAAGVEIDPRTKGPFVDESMQTSLPGVFACGNVAHVHDLVDFVTLESCRAGASAARYALGKANAAIRRVAVVPGEGVGYALPQKIASNAKDVELFFRVGRVFGDSVIEARSGGKTLAHFKRAHMTPGEMERVTLKADALALAQNEIIIEARESK